MDGWHQVKENISPVEEFSILLQKRTNTWHKFMFQVVWTGFDFIIIIIHKCINLSVILLNMKIEGR